MRRTAGTRTAGTSPRRRIAIGSAVAAGVALAVALSACTSGGTATDRAASRSQTTQPAAPTPPTSSPPTSPPDVSPSNTVGSPAASGSSGPTESVALSTNSVPDTTSTVAAPEPTATYAKLTEASFSTFGPDGMTAVAGSLWVKADDGRVVRIDPATNKIIAEMKVDQVSVYGKYCQGIGTDGTTVWACATHDDGTGVAQIDPNTNTIVRYVPAGKTFEQMKIPGTSRGMWVLADNGTKLSVVDPRSGELSSYPLPGRFSQLDAVGERLIATSVVDNSVVIVDAATGAVTRNATLDAPRSATLAGRDAWVDTAHGLVRLNGDLEPQVSYPELTAFQWGDIVAEGGSLWLREIDGTISRIDTATGKVIDRIGPETRLSGGSLLIAFGSVWTTESDENSIVRLRRP